jgi:DNA gyrase subunit A
MITIADKENDSILVVSSKGYGKRTNIQEYSRIKRGGKGVKTLSITDKTGDLIGLKNVNEDDDLMIILKSGMAIRTPIEGIREMGRSTQGVRLMKLKENDEIAAVAKVVKQEDESPVDSIENEEKE